MANDNGKFRMGIDFTDEQLRTALQSPEKLIEWAELSGRPFIMLNTRHVVQAVKWPEGVQIVQQIITAYRDHRRGLDSGFIVEQTGTNPTTGGRVQVRAPEMLDETLSLDEIELALAQLEDQRDTLLAEHARKKAVRA